MRTIPSDKHKFRRQALLAMALAVCAFLLPSLCSADQTNLPPLNIHVGFTRSSFRNANVHDAITAFRVFAQTAGRKFGYQVAVDAQLMRNAADLEFAIKKGDINLAIFDTWDYLGMDIHSVMEPVFVEVEQGDIYKEYLVLARGGSGLTNMAQLRGKELLLLEGKGGDLSRAWLDCLLLTNHLGPQRQFFDQVEPVNKPAAAILPVFFGSKPACLVDRAAFQIMAELNPQVGAQMTVLAQSDPYVEILLCVSKNGWPSGKARADLLRGIADLHLEPNGQQVLELFKLDKMEKFKDEDLDSARKLQRVLAVLPGSEAKR